ASAPANTGVARYRGQPTDDSPAVCRTEEVIHERSRPQAHTDRLLAAWTGDLATAFSGVVRADYRPLAVRAQVQVIVAIVSRDNDRKGRNQTG
ncbi:MAG: hypothetical protein M3Y58_20365, partial [Chloroflexota bacterium]|nr:hypothetical protein [Chloroflexota bacterium]